MHSQCKNSKENLQAILCAVNKSLAKALHNGGLYFVLRLANSATSTSRLDSTPVLRPKEHSNKNELS